MFVEKVLAILMACLYSLDCIETPVTDVYSQCRVCLINILFLIFVFSSASAKAIKPV